MIKEEGELAECYKSSSVPEGSAVNVTAASSVTVDGLVVISLLRVDALGLGNLIGRKTISPRRWMGLIQ